MSLFDPKNPYYTLVLKANYATKLFLRIAVGLVFLRADINNLTGGLSLIQQTTGLVVFGQTGELGQ